MTDPSTWPVYRSHKLVRAAKIVGMNQLPPAPGAPPDQLPQWSILFDPGDGGRAELTSDVKLFARGLAAPGDYLVAYEDGYISWSPAKAFEEGYRVV